MMAKRDPVDFNAQWLREMREHMGWSTTETAEHARSAAARCGDNLKLSQQLVSAFENGKHKMTPRWIGYVQMAMSEVLHGRGLPEGRLMELRLSEPLNSFFGARSGNWTSEEAVNANENAIGDRRLAFHGAPREIPPDPTGVVPVRQIDLKFGMGASYLDGDHPGETVHHFPAAWLRQYTKAPAEQLYFAEGFGDSMQPTLQANDLVLIDTSQQTMRMADAIWAVSFNGLGMIKRLRPTRDGGIKILSDNPHVPDEVAFDDELQLLGRVVAIVRKV